MGDNPALSLPGGSRAGNSKKDADGLQGRSSGADAGKNPKT
jgi:hypothetical protein